jgi:4-hydroxybenzoate polyprenyltransferase
MTGLTEMLIYVGLMFVSVLLLICVLIIFEYKIVSKIVDTSNDNFVLRDMKIRWALLCLLFGIDEDLSAKVQGASMQSTLRRYRILCGLLLVGVVIGGMGINRLIDADPKSHCPRVSGWVDCPH